MIKRQNVLLRLSVQRSLVPPWRRENFDMSRPTQPGPLRRFWEANISATARPIDKRASLLWTPSTLTYDIFNCVALLVYHILFGQLSFGVFALHSLVNSCMKCENGTYLIRAILITVIPTPLWILLCGAINVLAPFKHYANTRRKPTALYSFANYFTYQ